MDNNTVHSLLIVAVMAVFTALTRFLPFLAFPEGRKRPKVITYLGTVLPYALIGMLVIYCFKSVSIFAYPYCIPELLAVVLVALLHIWKRNTLISVFGGVIFYMVLVQCVF
ncbi:branched-chain amino acid transporter permease [Ruminococcus sp.]|jgi:branched-subunit amino acid transport protein AzlD|uniref:branched-chain amino acid transporter permease n=1 Tax=Ruminococcus sp. TaxID=41978 RepID=UPI0025CDA2DB|nr:AzlD domain-containing protein [Ruminococcus sp.]MCI2112420.1 AzlD domain-containing protein [Ruminococcus sp.]MDD6988930.1 AzlD domain-containing protein [Ruminococcus sp.]MDY6201681.1 AzlD domain-containing protein [Ruminococcus sp.]